jgi:hypothetical protein
MLQINRCHCQTVQLTANPLLSFELQSTTWQYHASAYHRAYHTPRPSPYHVCMTKAYSTHRHIAHAPTPWEREYQEAQALQATSLLQNNTPCFPRSSLVKQIRLFLFLHSKHYGNIQFQTVLFQLDY